MKGACRRPGTNRDDPIRSAFGAPVADDISRWAAGGAGRTRSSNRGKTFEAKRMVTTGTQCGKQNLSSTTNCNHQRRQRRSFSDQATRESKRKASKEASALSKEVQSISISSQADPEASADGR
ncbi:uncharacterized protein si:ch211-215i13.3 isoform X1 [Dunckerocampus dactyliophorus]|uniref:uncharacterized protein si:ch211-215i13.3 isoform X1 n=1 Tax=Dunckerocampus dactyliophorus TaxID=161453 RepID=UPI002406D609|nr:uncharacterized protein si:ch211-215i13.3 isoform X1 [Dunckerocampus dactyliophorus]